MDQDGIPTLMPDTAQPGMPGPDVKIGNFELQTVLGRGGMGEAGCGAWDKPMQLVQQHRVTERRGHVKRKGDT